MKCCCLPRSPTPADPPVPERAPPRARQTAEIASAGSENEGERGPRGPESSSVSRVSEVVEIAESSRKTAAGGPERDTSVPGLFVLDEGSEGAE